MKIRHKAQECIGCALCEQEAPDYFEMDDEGMAVLIRARKQGAFRQAEGMECDREALKRAEQGCPVNIIYVD